MNNTLKPSQLLGTIALPQQDKAKLEFCNSAKTSAVRNWVENLQATKIMQTNSMLYKALPELARLKTDFKTRFDMLEILRPVVHNATSGLEKSFLNQPLLLPDEAHKAVAVGQALRKNMADGYIAVAIQITENAKAKKHVLSLLGTAIHRVISNISHLFFRNYQIYSQTPTSLWATLHIVYQVARYYQLTEHPIIDDSLRSIKALSIEAAYTRVLMLAAAPTNKLTQSEIEVCFYTFENWCQHVTLEDGPSDDKHKHFVVDLLSASGPIPSQKLKGGTQATHSRDAQYLAVNFQALLNQLSAQAENNTDLPQTSAVKVPRGFSSNLLDHLIATWSNVAHRKQNRTSSESSADVCVGITNVHYCICNNKSFEHFLRSNDGAEPPDSEAPPRFSQGLTPASEPQNLQSKAAPMYRVIIQNTSSGGCCLLWQDDSSVRLAAGELLSFKEMGQRTWSLGVVRWVRQLKNASQVGVQLITSNAEACGVAQNHQQGGYSDYMRAFLIPPSKLGLSQPTLLTASAPLDKFDKVRLIDEKKQWRAKLERIVFSTKSVQQFEYATISVAGDDKTSPKQKTGPQNSNFDSTWDK